MAATSLSPSSGPVLPSVLKCSACRNTLQNIQPPKADDDDDNGGGGSSRRGPRRNKDLIPVVEEDSMPVPRWIQERIDEVRGQTPSCVYRMLGSEYHEILLGLSRAGGPRGRSRALIALRASVASTLSAAASPATSPSTSVKKHLAALTGLVEYTHGVSFKVRSKVDVHTPKDLRQLMTESRNANWPPRNEAVAAAVAASGQGSIAGAATCGGDENTD